jgi:uncharacterized coiled-coil protein SlyX
VTLVASRLLPEPASASPRISGTSGYLPPPLLSVGSRWMTQTGGRLNLEDRIRELKASLDKYITGEAELSSAVATDLTKAVHELADHLVELHRRVEKMEETVPEWTTRGWTPPPGSDTPQDD